MHYIIKAQQSFELDVNASIAVDMHTDEVKMSVLVCVIISQGYHVGWL